MMRLIVACLLVIAALGAARAQTPAAPAPAAPAPASPAMAQPAVPAARLAININPMSTQFMAPDTPLMTETGIPTNLSAYKGRVVIATFWATWCHVCADEMPQLDAIAASYDPRALSVASISIDQVDPTGFARNWLSERGLNNLPAIGDENGMLFADIGGYATPTTLIIDKFGQVTAGIVGAANWGAPEMAQYLNALVMAETPEASLALLQ